MVKRAAKCTRLIIILSLALLAVFFFLPETSRACSGPTEPPNFTPSPIEDRVKAATTIFYGTVISGEDLRTSIFSGNSAAYQAQGITVKAQVLQYFKGVGPTTVTINGFGY
jgi:hypothetical protein